jgi:hypothetical protein
MKCVPFTVVLSTAAVTGCPEGCMLGEMIKERPYTSCKLLDLYTLPPRLVSRPTAQVLQNSDS